MIPFSRQQIMLIFVLASTCPLLPVLINSYTTNQFESEHLFECSINSWELSNMIGSLKMKCISAGSGSCPFESTFQIGTVASCGISWHWHFVGILWHCGILWLLLTNFYKYFMFYLRCSYIILVAVKLVICIGAERAWLDALPYCKYICKVSFTKHSIL